MHYMTVVQILVYKAGRNGQTVRRLPVHGESPENGLGLWAAEVDYANAPSPMGVEMAVMVSSRL